MTTPVIKDLSPTSLGTKSEKRWKYEDGEWKQDKLSIPLWMFFAAAICGALIASIPMLAVGYHYGEMDMERAACRAGVAKYVYSEDGNHQFEFESRKNQVPSKPNKPQFNLFD